MPPARSGIADYSAKLRPALAEKADVVYFSENSDIEDGIQPLPAPLNVLNRAEYTVFHIGNNASMHRPIWELSTVKRGIAVLHDTRLQHLFAGIFLYQIGSEQAFLDLLEVFYGPEGRNAGRDYRAGRMTINDLAVVAPMTELACMNSSGVVTHSSDESDRLERLGIPVRRLNLPHPANRVDDSVPVKAESEEIRLLVFGFISENRCLEEVLIALGRNRRKDRFRLTVAGTVAPEIDLEAVAARHGVSDRIDRLGFVEEDELDRLLRSSDLVFNLRFPSMGEASSAQLRIWANAAPSVVTSVGWYRDIPEGVVLRVAPGRQAAEIESILDTLLSDRSAFESVGRRGHEHLRNHHSPEQYVEGLIELCEASREREPCFSDFHIVDRVRRKAAAVTGHASPGGLFPALKRALSEGGGALPTTTTDRSVDA